MERSNKQKYRHELKYLCSEQEKVLLEYRVKGLMQLDKHVGKDEHYHIRSVYFDDYANTCYYMNESGVNKRAKYRIRIYNCSDQNIKLEKKIKQNGMTRKLSATLTRKQCEVFLKGDCISLEEADFKTYPRLLQEFCLLVKNRGFLPKVIVIYDRKPYIYRHGNVRLTLDENIASSIDFEHFFDCNIRKRPILELGRVLMEIKYDAYFPSFIKQNLQLGSLSQTTFSKYYLCRKYSLGQ